MKTFLEKVFKTFKKYKVFWLNFAAGKALLPQDFARMNK